MNLVCDTLGIARSSYYAWRQGGFLARNQRREPRPGAVPEEMLLAGVKEVIAESPFCGEGHRKVWARLRRDKGIFASRKRVLRVMRENGLLAPTRRVHRHSDGRHDGTIIPEAPNRLWGTDATRVETEMDGWGWVFVCIDHYNLEAWAEVVKVGDRFAALEPIRQAVRERFGGFRSNIARGLRLRHDHGSQYMSDHFLKEIKWLGIVSSPAFVGEPECNGVAEWFNRQLKEQVLWTRRFTTLDEARQAVQEFVDRFNREWLVERLGYRSPKEACAEFLRVEGTAA